MATRTDSINIPRYADDSTMLESFIEDMENYFIAINISSDQNAAQCAAQLLCQAGRKIREVVKNTKTIIEKLENENDYNYIKRIILEKELPKKNTTFESYQFRNIKQKEGEPFQKFLARLESQITRCEYGDRNRQLKDQIVIGCLSDHLRKVALRDDLQLQRLLDLGKTEECAVANSKTIQSESSDESGFRVSTRNQYNKPRYDNPSASQRTCYNCGLKFPHQNQCPAAGKPCYKCGKVGHLGKVCRSSSKRYGYQRSDQVTQEDVYNDEEAENAHAINVQEYVFRIGSGVKQSSLYSLLVDNIPVDFIPDTGATVNIIDYETFVKLKQIKHYPMFRTTTKVYSYGSTTPLPLKGMFFAKLSNKSSHVLSKLYVLEKYQSGNLLSKDVCMKLNVLKFNDNTEICNEISISDDTNNTISTGVANGTSSKIKDFGGRTDWTSKIESTLEAFPDGIGKLKNFELHIQVDPSATPVIQRTRPVPFSQRKFVETTTSEMLEADIIEEVHKIGTTWLSPIHVVQREGKQRMTVDMRVANTAISRIRKPIPTPEEVLAELDRAQFFSKVDLKSAYLQIPLDESSRDITTFQTHTGIFRFKRLFFGVTSACEQFQGILSSILSDIKGCKNIADDIIVYGHTKAEHDQALLEVLTRLLEAGLTINRQKSVFGQRCVEFFGYKVSDKGIQPLIKDSLLSIQKPTNTSEVRSYIGMVNFISRFIPNFSTTMAPISKLLSNDTPFEWGAEQDDSFDKILQEIRDPRILQHFDYRKATEVITDASPIGMSGILTQDGKPVKFLSRKLSKVEQRYSQTEREALAVIWACEKLHFFLYGIKFTVRSDHKPLQVLYAPHGKPCARILRWALRLLPYSFDIKHIPGVKNPADYFSRKPTCDPCEEDERKTNDTEGFVNHVLIATTPNSISFQEIIAESHLDKDIMELSTRLQDGKWHLSPQLKLYKAVKEEISAKNGIITKDNRMIVPRSLRKRCLELAHLTHLGMEKTKQYLRSKVWWPRMDTEVSELIQTCGICAAVNPEGRERLEPLKIKAVPSKPFSTVHIDLFGPLSSGVTILGIIDELSRWPELYVLESTQTKDVIQALNKTFGRFGNPDTLISDNGPQLASWEFKNYLAKEGIKQHLITPYYPQANSSIERFFRTLKKFVKVCTLNDRELSTQLDNFLMMYRNTPIRATGFTPAEMVLRYHPNGKIPSARPYPKITTEDMYKKALTQENSYKAKTKELADKDQKRTKDSQIQKGDRVLVKYKQPKKSQSLYDPNPFTVTYRKGNCVYLRRNGKQLRRPLNLMKKVPVNLKIPYQYRSVEDYYSPVPDSRAIRLQTNGQNQQAENQVPVIRNTLNRHSFRDNVFRDNTSAQPHGTVNDRQEAQDIVITGSGRISRPVLGNRLCDTIT